MAHRSIAAAEQISGQVKPMVGLDWFALNIPGSEMLAPLKKHSAASYGRQVLHADDDNSRSAMFVEAQRIAAHGQDLIGGWL